MLWVLRSAMPKHAPEKFLDFFLFFFFFFVCVCFFLFCFCFHVCLFVLRFYSPFNPMGSCRAPVSLPNHTFIGQA